jgi:hypothetical protein
MISYENNILNNIAIITIKLSNNYILYLKQINSLIKIFAYNNTYFAFYDTRSTINIFSLLCTPLYLNNYIADVTTMDLYDNYILVITNDNQIIISDFKNKKNLYSNKLLCLSLNNSYTMQKINNLYFLSLNYIIIEIIESSVYSNITKKKIVYYNSEKNEFVLSSDDSLSFSDKIKIDEKERNDSIYVNFMKQMNFDYNMNHSDNDYKALDLRIIENFDNFNKNINLTEKKIIAANLEKITSYYHMDYILKDFDMIIQVS